MHQSRTNALAETVNGLFKAEVIWRRGPRRSFKAVEFATLEWVDWFNNRCLLEPIGNMPSAEAEARYYAQAEAASLGRLTQPKWPPTNPERLNVSEAMIHVAMGSLLLCRIAHR